MRTIRNENLRRLIDDKFASSQPSFEKATGIKMAQIGQWLAPEGGDYSRNMSERSARKIESSCLLPTGWMDTDHSGNTNAVTPTIEGAWPFTGITQEEYQTIPQDIREDIEDYIRMKLSKIKELERKSAA